MKYMNVVWCKQNSSVFQVDSASFKDSLFYYSCPRYFVYITYSVGSRPGGLLCEPVVVHLSVCLMRAISTAISADQSLRQTDAGWTVIRCCLTLAQCETCVLSVGLSAGLEWAPTMHGSTGVRVVQSCVWGLVQMCTSIFFFSFVPSLFSKICFLHTSTKQNWSMLLRARIKQTGRDVTLIQSQVGQWEAVNNR